MAFTCNIAVVKLLRVSTWFAVAALPLLSMQPATAYVPDQRWTTTASGGTGGQGTPITLTWSIVPDGTAIPGRSSSNLQSYLNQKIGAGAWLPLLQESFDRWTELGGIKFVYESRDDGVSLNSASGALGVRGDIRISGAFIDGASGTLAYASLPNDGDMVFDTGESSFYSNSASNYLQLRNTVMHETGHAFGLLHIESNTDNLLMEPFINSTFDGPQLDDIRGLHGLYGDKFEKTNGGLGNDIFSRATSLGALSVGGSLSIGTDAATGQRIETTETNFVSIDTNTDTDFYSFNLSAPANLNITLTPLGGTFNQSAEGGTPTPFNASARSDLILSVLASNGSTILGTSNIGGAGTIESITGLSLVSAGQYYVRITGATDAVQLYQLQLSAISAIAPLAGDYNKNGIVDAADYVTWRDQNDQVGTNLAADGNNDGIVNDLDYIIWKSHLGMTAGTGTALTSVPEPKSILYWLTTLVVLLGGRRSWLSIVASTAPVGI